MASIIRASNMLQVPKRVYIQRMFTALPLPKRLYEQTALGRKTTIH